MDTTHDWQMPSGSEVESAAWHESPHGGIRGRLDALKSRSLSKVHDVQTSLVTARGSVRDGAKSQVAKVQDSMRTSPMKWAGIAAGTGFALGLVGRIAQARNKRKHAMPTLVIVEASC
jgi:hypothetical protein